MNKGIFMLTQRRLFSTLHSQSVPTIYNNITPNIQYMDSTLID